MADALRPPPYKIPIVDKTGLISNIWIAWFRQMFLRIGGSSALSNTELEAIVNVDLVDTQNDVATLQTQVATLLSSVDGLNQGPNL